MQKRHTPTAIAVVSPRSDRAIAFQEMTGGNQLDWSMPLDDCYRRSLAAQDAPALPVNEFDG